MSLEADKPRLRPAQKEDGSYSYRTFDSYTNLFTRTGLHANNLSGGGHYRVNPISRDRMQLEWIYRGNWVARTIIDAPADDMTREGVEIQSEDSPEDIERLNKAAETLRIWTKLGKTIKWGRLYGGSLGYLLIDGQDPKTELKLETVGKDQFKGILPLDRWMAWPNTTDIISDMVPDFGLPRSYKLWPDTGTGLPITEIHHSRLLKFDGVDIPYWQRIAENYWGLSVLEPIWDRIMAFDSTTQGAAQLVYKAHLRTVKIKGFRDIIGTNDVATQGLKKFFDMVRVFQSSEGLTLLDQDDEFDVHQYSFAGLSDMMLQFAQQLAGAAEIPMVRFFAQSPAGLNATGESDWRNYYDGIRAKQERILRPGIELVYALLYRSTLGREPKKPLTINFRSLWQMTDEQSATVSSSIASAIATLVDKQVLDRPTALKEIKQLSGVTGFGTNITEDDIKKAEQQQKEAEENPPEPGDADLDDPTLPNNRQKADAKGAAGAKSGTNGSGATHVRVSVAQGGARSS